MGSNPEPLATAVVPALHDEECCAGVSAWCVGSDDASQSVTPRLASRHPDTHDFVADKGAPFPAVGEYFEGFRLVMLLGKGAFGRVYLAEQPSLANRNVALKVARDIFGESQTLAQLQHTNIVPIHSIHRTENFQAVCMPYFGSTTLAEVFRNIGSERSLPKSGKLLVDTVNQRKQSTHHALADSVPSASHVKANLTTGPISDANRLPPTGDATCALQALGGMSYVEAVLTIGARLADGLAHAHEHGILHHDLKPANILLTDDGQPMLLDFNLAQDTKHHGTAADAMVGGTLPYMSPEHLEAFSRRTQQLDARSDIYALGVILYELLTGRPPFPVHRKLAADTIGLMLEERRRHLPALGNWHPGATPAVAAIVARCLAPDPSRRYQTARELQEDLERQLHDLPLKHAPDRSIRERARKWIRRHPHLTSTTTVGAVLGGVLLFLLVALQLRNRQLTRLQAQETLGQFESKMRAAQFFLYSRHADRDQLEEGMACCREALGRFGVLEDPNWREEPKYRALPPEEQDRLRNEAGETLFLLARAQGLMAQYYGPPGERDSGLLKAEHLNRAACLCFDEPPRALLEQRAEIARLRGLTELAERFAAQARATPAKSPHDLYLIAHQQAIRGNLREALSLLQRVAQEDPSNFSAWFVRGNCHYELLQDGDAVACFNTCVALRPDFHWSWFNRGLAHLRQRHYAQAVQDFDRVLVLKPNLADAYVNRALAKEGLQQYQDAIDDYSRALDVPSVSTRVYFLRSAARLRLKDPAGAMTDYQLGLATEPKDEAGWIARGLARVQTDPEGALADFDRALKVNPRSFEGLQNKAAILVDKFNKDAEALKVMEDAVKLYPDSAMTRGGRGVLLARIGKRDAALDDARACLLLDTNPPMLYQAACIYALISKENREDRLEALHLLSSALRGGFGLEFVDQDKDLDPLRGDQEFKRAVAAARALAGGNRN